MWREEGALLAFASLGFIVKSTSCTFTITWVSTHRGEFASCHSSSCGVLPSVAPPTHSGILHSFLACGSFSAVFPMRFLQSFVEPLLGFVLDSSMACTFVHSGRAVLHVMQDNCARVLAAPQLVPLPSSLCKIPTLK